MHTIYGSNDDDFIFGTSGQDKIISLGGNDLIYARTGDDWLGDGLHGEASNDGFFGGAGNDLFVNRSGNDFMFGGAGDDVFNILGSDTVTINGGKGHDVAYLHIHEQPEAFPIDPHRHTTFALLGHQIHLHGVEEVYL